MRQSEDSKNPKAKPGTGDAEKEFPVPEGEPSHAEAFVNRISQAQKLYAAQKGQTAVEKANAPHLEGGTPAFRELLSQDGQCVADFEAAQRQYRGRVTELEGMLAGVDEIERCLDRLQKARAQRSKVLHILAIEIRGRQGRRYPAEIRRRNRNLKRLANRVRSMTEEIERVYSDPATYPDIFGVALQILPDRVTPVSERIPQRLIEELRALADDLEIKVRDWGDLFRRGGVGDYAERTPVFLLLAYLQHTTRDARKHLHTVADLLHSAYEACGIRKRVSIDSLDKLLTRHVLPSFRQH